MDTLRLPAPPDLIWSDTHFFHVAMQWHYPWRCDVIGRERPLASGEVTMEDAARFADLALQTLDGHPRGATLLHLGDVAMGQSRRHVVVRDAFLRSGLRILLVRGNHDGTATRCTRLGVATVCNAVRFDVDGKVVTARHDPMHFTEEDARCSDVLLHGHCHGNTPPPEIPDLVRPKLVDVSMDRIRVPRPLDWAGVMGLSHAAP